MRKYIIYNIYIYIKKMSQHSVFFQQRFYVGWWCKVNMAVHDVFIVIINPTVCNDMNIATACLLFWHPNYPHRGGYVFARVCSLVGLSAEFHKHYHRIKHWACNLLWIKIKMWIFKYVLFYIGLVYMGKHTNHNQHLRLRYQRSQFGSLNEHHWRVQ